MRRDLQLTSVAERRMYRAGISYARSLCKVPKTSCDPFDCNDSDLIESYVAEEQEAVRNRVAMNVKSWRPIVRPVDMVAKLDAKEATWLFNDAARSIWVPLILTEQNFEAYNFAFDLRSRFASVFERYRPTSWRELLSSISQEHGFVDLQASICDDEILPAAIRTLLRHEPEFKIGNHNSFERAVGQVTPTMEDCYDQICLLRSPKQNGQPQIFTDIDAITEVIKNANRQIQDIRVYWAQANSCKLHTFYRWTSFCEKRRQGRLYADLLDRGVWIVPIKSLHRS